jgi:hypothetical protein
MRLFVFVGNNKFTAGDGGKSSNQINEYCLRVESYPVLSHSYGKSYFQFPKQEIGAVRTSIPSLVGQNGAIEVVGNLAPTIFRLLATEGLHLKNY